MKTLLSIIAAKGEPLPKPKNIGKRKDEKERMEKK